MSKKLSIKDISRLSGVSVATVSRVIHQNGRFSAETEKRVLQVIEDQKYEPDIIAQTMRTKVMPIIGVLITDFLNERSSLFVRAAQETLNAAGYQMIVFNTRGSSDAAQYFVKMMRSQHAAGFLVFSDCRLPADCFENANVVYVWNEPLVKPSAPYSIARFDYYSAGMTAVEHLFEQGCRRVAILRRNDELSSQEGLYRGYLDAHKKHGIAPAEELSINLNNRRTVESIDYLNRYLDENGLAFDGVFCGSYNAAIVTMSVFRNRGIRMPEDARMVGFCDLRMSRYGLLRYTAISEDEEELGRRAVDMLLKKITRTDTEAREIILPVRLRKGSTT